MSKLYIVFKNIPANEMFIKEIDTDTDWTYQSVGGSFADAVADFSDPVEAHIFIEEQKKNSTEYAVYETQNGHTYIVEMNCCSGSYQDNKQNDYDEYIKSFYNKIEAERYAISLEDNVNYILTDMGTVESFENHHPAINHSLTGFTVYAVEAVNRGKLGYAIGFKGNIANFDKYSDDECTFIRVSGNIEFDWYEPVER